MKFLFSAILVLLLAATFTGCSENYSNGERVGFITQFSRTGSFYKSWEGHLNVTQTGMNSSVPFDFSIDNDNEDAAVINKIDSAAKFGWKVRLTYHQTRGKNWGDNRGETDYFISSVEVLDRERITVPTLAGGNLEHPGRVDTIYVVIDRTKDENNNKQNPYPYLNK